LAQEAMAASAGPAKAAAVAAAAASRFKGRYAVHPVLPGAAQLIADSCRDHISPAWAPGAQELFSKWGTIAPCMPKYLEFLKKTNRKDIKKIQVFMNESAQAKLGEFYLCCAFRLRQEEVEAAGSDAQKLLAIAGRVANEEVEPFFEACRKFVEDYDEALHKELDNTTVWREVEDSLFWHHSFVVSSPKEYVDYQRSVLPPEAEWPDGEDTAGLEAVLTDCSKAVAEGGPGRPLAEDVYRRFLDASATPLKASLRTALIDHGVVWGEVNYRSRDDPSGSE